MLLPLLASLAAVQALPPSVGSKAPDFALRTLDSKTVRLAPLLKQGPVVLVVLRGYPGYQCPFCTQQVGELIQKSEDFEKRSARLVFVYPGPTEGLAKYAGDFVTGKDMPKNYSFTVDPGYRLIQSYGLRWEAPNETAYPSSFVIARNGRVTYAKVSREHGDRAPVAELIDAVSKLPKG
jgi:peroxiredoxin